MVRRCRRMSGLHEPRRNVGEIFTKTYIKFIIIVFLLLPSYEYPQLGHTRLRYWHAGYADYMQATSAEGK